MPLTQVSWQSFAAGPPNGCAVQLPIVALSLQAAEETDVCKIKMNMRDVQVAAVPDIEHRLG